MKAEIKQGPLNLGGNTSAMRLRLRLLDSAAAASGKKLIHFVKEIGGRSWICAREAEQG